MSKKLIVLFLILSLLIVTSLSGCSNDQSAPAPTENGNAGDESNGTASESVDAEFEITIAHLTSTIDPLHIGYEYLGQMLEERSNGRIKMSIFGNAQISGSDREQAEMVQNNIIQMTSAPSYTLAGISSNLPEFYVYDLPYMFITDEDIWRFSDGEIGQRMLDDLLRETGIRSYGAFPIGWVKVSNNTRPVDKPEDLRGISIRTTTSEFYVGTMQAFGANPTPMAYGEVFTALQQGTVNGMMTATSLYASDRFYEVQDYMTTINPFAITHYPLISDEWYQSLPDDLQQIFDESMAEYMVFMRDLEYEAELAALDTLRGHGMEIVELTEDQLQPFIDLAMPLWDSLAENVGGIDFVDEVYNYLN